MLGLRRSGAWSICLVVWSATFAAAAEDGKRAVVVPRFGVKLRVPQAWSLVDWARNDKAFELDLPQDSGSLVGHVRCTVTVVPESLERYRRAFADAVPAPGPTVTQLVANQLSDLTTPQFPAELVQLARRRLTAQWEFQDAQGRRWGERRVLLICRGLLYSFALDSDEAHFDAYCADFEEMFAGLDLEPPALGLTPLAGGYWMQNDLHFTIMLPESWSPTLGPNNRVLLYAAGHRHGERVDHIAVQVSAVRPLDLQQLKVEAAREAQTADPGARVQCSIVSQQGKPALETLIRTERGGERLVVLQRRFSGRGGNYELKVSCSAGEFDLHEQELRRALESFRETDAAAPQET